MLFLKMPIIYLIFFLVQYVMANSTNVGKIKILNGNINEGEYVVYLYDKYMGNTQDLKIHIEGKICDAQTFSEFKNCLEYKGIYNNKWVIINF